MNSFEWFLLLILAASLVVGPLIGYRAGMYAFRQRVNVIVANERARQQRDDRDSRAYQYGRQDGFLVGYREGSTDSNDDDVIEVGDIFAPKRAADVRLSE